MMVSELLPMYNTKSYIRDTQDFIRKVKDGTKRILKPIGKHFSLPGHSNGHLKTFLLETIPGDPKLSTTTSRRKSRERFWIFRLRTPETLGLNSAYSAKLKS
jgi:hypothetical protein